jgi:pSer/pThr/pTyr-binding forkhead associated (FHA) protein
MVKALVLTAITGMQIGRRYTVSERVNTIGSGPQCDVVLNDRHLSTRHAEISARFSTAGSSSRWRRAAFR